MRLAVYRFELILKIRRNFKRQKSTINSIIEPSHPATTTIPLFSSTELCEFPRYIKTTLSKTPRANYAFNHTDIPSPFFLFSERRCRRPMLWREKKWSKRAARGLLRRMTQHSRRINCTPGCERSWLDREGSRWLGEVFNLRKNCSVCFNM